MEYVLGVVALLGAFGTGMAAESWIRRGDIEHVCEQLNETWHARLDAVQKATRMDLLARAVNEAVAGGRDNG
jgi:hypothetical protein